MPKTPRIFINMHYLEIGGAETSLIGLLQALHPARVAVDLFLNDHRGEMMQYIPAWVNVLPEVAEYTMIERPIKEVIKKGYLKVAAARLWAKICHGYYVWKKHPVDGSAIFGYVGKWVTPCLPSLRALGEYDLAISFLTPHNIVLNKVSAQKKICWIHTDYTQIDANIALELPVWDGYDCIASISEDVTKTFLQVFPSLNGKMIEIENILSPVFIRNLATQVPCPPDMQRKGSECVLLTIGRYSFPKRLEAIPAISRFLVDRGCDVKWYIIGYGGSDTSIRQAIADYSMEAHVTLLGKRFNPYPYIQACDWYVQPSRYEGKSVVVREAQILCKPVIITAYPTATSQVADGADGVIVPMPLPECAEAISVAIQDFRLRQHIVDYLSVHDYGNEKETEKIYRLIQT